MKYFIRAHVLLLHVCLHVVNTIDFGAAQLAHEALLQGCHLFPHQLLQVLTYNARRRVLA